MKTHESGGINNIRVAIWLLSICFTQSSNPRIVQKQLGGGGRSSAVGGPNRGRFEARRYVVSGTRGPLRDFDPTSKRGSDLVIK